METSRLHSGARNGSRWRYACFISYKHGAAEATTPALRGDSVLAQALHRLLHRLARPWWKRRALHVFRDETVLAADADLGAAIVAALGQSEHLLLLASPEAAASPWVRKEVTQWLRDDPAGERVIIALTGGMLHWNEAMSGFDPATTTALPPALFDAIRREPKWIDLRSAASPSAAVELRAAAIEISARLHHCTPEELAGEDVRRQRQVVRGLLAGLVAMAALAGVAWLQRQNAVRAQTVAEAGQLALEGRLAAQRDPREATPLIASAIGKLQALDLPMGYEQEVAVRDGLAALRDTVHWSAESGGMLGMAVHDESLLLASADMLQRREAASGKTEHLPWTDADGMPLGTVAMDVADGQAVLIGLNVAGATRLHRLDLGSGEWTSLTLADFPKPAGIAALRGGDVLAVSREGKVRRIGSDGQPRAEWTLAAAGPVACGDFPLVCVLADRAPTFTGVATSPGTAITTNARLIVLDPDTGNHHVLESPHGAIGRLHFGDHAFWSIGSEGLVQRYETNDGHLERRGEPRRTAEGPATAIAADNDRLAVGSRAGLVRVWLGGEEHAFELRGHVAAVRGLTFDAKDRCRLWSLGADGQARGWDLCAPVAVEHGDVRWSAQSDDGARLADASMTNAVVRHGEATQNLPIACAVGGDRSADVLAVSNGGDIFAVCTDEQRSQTAQWLRDGQPPIDLDEDDYHPEMRSVWFQPDGSVIYSVGSLMSVIPDLPLPPSIKPARLIRATADGGRAVLDTRSYGLVLALTANPSRRELLAGTSTGRLLRLDPATLAVRANIDINAVANPNSANPMIAAKGVACCTRDGLVLVVLGTLGMPAAMMDTARDLVVTFDLSANAVVDRLEGERRSVLGQSILPGPERIALVYGGMDPMAMFDSSASLRLFDRHLRPTSPAYPIPGGLAAQIVPVPGGERIRMIGLGAGQLTMDTSLHHASAEVLKLAQESRQADLVNAVLQRADERQQQGDWTQVDALLSRVLALDPSRADIWVRRGNARLSLRRVDEAIADYDQANTLDPLNPFVALQRGKALMFSTNRLDDAELELTRATERAYMIIRPNLPVGDDDNPLHAFNRTVMETTITISRAGQAEPWMLRARVRLAQGKLDLARSDIARVRSLGVSNDEVAAIEAAIERAGQGTVTTDAVPAVGR